MEFCNSTARLVNHLRKTLRIHAGFTLIELLVVIAMLGVLTIGLIATFNPATQFSKAKDSQRQHDLGQIQRALDSYFNDTGCYPTSITFGQSWSVNGQVYMEEVPQDPDCTTSPNNCYVYQTDTTTSCPQWSILYASLRGAAVASTACLLQVRNNSSACLPNGYADTYNFCVVSGNIDCSVISGTTIVSSGSSGSGGGGSGGGGGGQATPTPLVCPNDQYYGCTGNSRCNSISPKTQCNGYGGNITCYCDQHCNQSCQFN